MYLRNTELELAQLASFFSIHIPYTCIMIIKTIFMNAILAPERKFKQFINCLQSNPIKAFK